VEVVASSVPDAFVARLSHRGVKTSRISDGRYTFELPDGSPEPFIAELAATGGQLVLGERPPDDPRRRLHGARAMTMRRIGLVAWHVSRRVSATAYSTASARSRCCSSPARLPSDS
jgi:hypothetical protein